MVKCNNWLLRIFKKRNIALLSHFDTLFLSFVGSDHDDQSFASIASSREVLVAKAVNDQFQSYSRITCSKTVSVIIHRKDIFSSS